MVKRIAIALTFVSALVLAGLGMNSSAEAGCPYGGGGYYGGYGGYAAPYGGYGYSARRSSFYGGYGFGGGYGGYYVPRYRGLHFSIGF